MDAAFGGILILAGFGVMIWGGIMILPIARYRGRKRRALALVVGGFVGMMVGGSLVAPAPGKQVVAAKSKASPPPLTADIPADVSAETRQRFVNAYHAMLAAVGPCDRGIGAAGIVAGKIGSGGATVIDAYSAAKDGFDACDSAWQHLRDLSVPSDLPTEVGAKMANTQEACSNAYFARRQGMEAMMKVLDGDPHPSQVLEAKEQLQLGQSEILHCVAGWLDAATGIGAKLT